MTTESLSWGKTKDALVIAIGGLLVAFLGVLARGQAEANSSLAEVKRDIAVILVEKQRDREEMLEMKDRLRALEARKG